MKMSMSDGEIITGYKQAKDKKKQITVLADLNGVRTSEMREHLLMLGLELPTSNRRGKKSDRPVKPPIDELRAMGLHQEGLDDLGIAEALGETVNRVRQWRVRMHLKPNRAKETGGVSERAEASAPVGEAEVGQAEAPPPEPSAEMGKTNEKGNPENGLSVKALARILGDVAKMFPEADVRIGEEHTIQGAFTSVEYGTDGAVSRVTLILCE